MQSLSPLSMGVFSKKNIKLNTKFTCSKEMIFFLDIWVLQFLHQFCQGDKEKYPIKKVNCSLSLNKAFMVLSFKMWQISCWTIPEQKEGSVEWPTKTGLSCKIFKSQNLGRKNWA